MISKWDTPGLNYITCYTLVDITNTGITGTFRAGIMPMKTLQGKQFTTEAAWQANRNKQRNWETLNQVLGLRTQPVKISPPVMLNKQLLANYKFGSAITGTHRVWKFIFASEYIDVYDNMPGDYALLCEDASDVPIILKLSETYKIMPQFVTKGEHTNLYFERYEKN